MDEAPGAPADSSLDLTRWPTPTTGEAWPVGAVFINVDGTDPGTQLGYGTWTAFGAGRALFGFASGDPDFGVAEGTGGAKTATVATHGSHTHNVTANVSTTTAAVQSGAGTTVVTAVTGGTSTSSAESAALAHDPLSILPPYIVVYFWKRTA